MGAKVQKVAVSCNFLSDYFLISLFVWSAIDNHSTQPFVFVSSDVRQNARMDVYARNVSLGSSVAFWVKSAAFWRKRGGL